MSLDIFLKVDGIEGESLDAAHPKEIVALSFGWSAANTAAGPGGGGGGAGKVQFRDLSVVKPVDKASPKLMLACATGRHIRQCVLAVRRATAGDFMVLTLTDCVVTSIAESGSREAGAVQETITLGFASIVVQERPQKPDGSFDTPVTAGWNTKTNAPI